MKQGLHGAERCRPMVGVVGTVFDGAPTIKQPLHVDLSQLYLYIKSKVTITRLTLFLVFTYGFDNRRFFVCLLFFNGDRPDTQQHTRATGKQTVATNTAYTAMTSSN